MDEITHVPSDTVHRTAEGWKKQYTKFLPHGEAVDKANSSPRSVAEHGDERAVLEPLDEENVSSCPGFKTSGTKSKYDQSTDVENTTMLLDDLNIKGDNNGASHGQDLQQGSNSKQDGDRSYEDKSSLFPYLLVVVGSGMVVLQVC